jgi:hypothetical protein
MSHQMEPAVKTRAFTIALWTGSFGLFAYVLRRLIRRRQTSVQVGSVSEDWLAHHRGSGDDSL